jgi:hypothetical protein
MSWNWSDVVAENTVGVSETGSVNGLLWHRQSLFTTPRGKRRNPENARELRVEPELKALKADTLAIRWLEPTLLENRRLGS